MRYVTHVVKRQGFSAVISALLIFSLLIAYSTSAHSQQILIFGGDNNREFLGCLTCNEYDTNSVFNDFSTYGWGNDFGKWNPFGNYANSFSSYSACNQFTSNSPVLVDRQGKFYGRLTLNEYVQGSVCGVSGSEQICMSLKTMCANK